MAGRMPWRVPEGWRLWWADRPWRRIRATESLKLSVLVLIGILAVWAISAHSRGERRAQVLGSSVAPPTQSMSASPTVAATPPAPRGSLYLAVEDPHSVLGSNLHGYGSIEEVVGPHVVWIVPLGEFDSVPAVLPRGIVTERLRHAFRRHSGAVTGLSSGRIRACTVHPRTLPGTSPAPA